ncbi:N-formylglutamate amidohydrolase [Palleronia aestuarii]|uniref:N-formylglutamate amidohydrolase n=1 Tax=Palleronia aestuarii TaxID=568105 RepID=A0A2W7NTE0_9RHOB|nr:N-formylglutamate amidohydrolase [Palleronia aestuarii]PZX16596.1 N-formylglutamate amidohydrolase [Palleronia aestuarii]
MIFASPHSGRLYPNELLSRSVLSPLALRSSEDAFVDDLFGAAPAEGAPILTARLPRAWLDLNRASDELDPALFDGLGRGPHNPRVASGLGVVPRVVSGGRAIYRGKLDLVTAQRRIRQVWQPYHATLHRLIEESHDAFGQAVLIDCHSMPHEALDGVSVGGRRPNVVLGDRYGAAADPDLVDAVERAFEAEGMIVSRNAPFAGAFITQHYGRPARGRHVVQVEIDRSLYMNEATIEPHSGYAQVKATLTRVLAEITRIGRPADTALAAE